MPCDQVIGIDKSAPGNTWNQVGVKLIASPQKSFVAQPSDLFRFRFTQFGCPSAWNRFCPLRTLSQRE